MVVYYDGQLPQNSFGDPQTAIQYYNYMRGFWRDGTKRKKAINLSSKKNKIY